MSYRKSRARKTFDQSMDQMLKVIKEAYSSDCKSIKAREFVLCSAVMLCTANIEVYLEDLIQGWILKVNSLAFNCDKLPNNIRAFYLNIESVKNAYRGFITSNDEITFLEKITKTLGHNAFLLAFNHNQLPTLDAKLIYNDKKYPSPRNVNHLFCRLGINNIFHKLNSIAKSDQELVLKSFNDLRTAFAHQGIPVGLNNNDIKSKLKQIRRLVYFIDKVFYEHVKQHTGISTWVV
jgi:hypothetical protein